MKAAEHVCCDFQIGVIPRLAHCWCAAIVLAMCLISTGCYGVAQFNLNEVYLTKQERDARTPIPPERRRQLGDVMIAMFGTPDDPQMPDLGELDYSEVVDIDKLIISAGPVSSDESGRGLGLYREHCAHCHGVSGDGAGPTASFLNPYPRDYRRGDFKFKSTPKGVRPTHEDLRLILTNGIPGTAMPSFKVLPDNELDALIHYVRYLSIRGEVERLLLEYVAKELDSNQPLFDFEGGDAKAEQQTEQVNILKSFATEVVQKWVDAESQAVPIPAANPQRDRTQSVARGKELFFGSVANCVKCHGDTALGDGQTTDFDEWTKELEPQNSTALAAYLDAGALHPRNIEPRNLRLGVFRGGMRPIDIFWRIRNGIDGTPMPGAALKADDAGPEVKGLTTEDIWSIVDYVRSLAHDPISKPSLPEPSLERSRL